ncbi:baseplate J/gp47 family protein [Massilia sp. DJPM01]|uniref:baseplate assembly protein n=1 Tax=Massilia sp. DJPM01 TaxID=3024404 RepID=UPI00259DFC01|nr:baseplate J/gp47 family protein [Massilia sp. DJPM01]MDM5178518.1 baseplate J/gp47 family protein [Massilia sp. DJPM01]
MAGAFTAVDLSQLPFPDAVESLDYETILTAMLADLQARDPLFSALVESDPAFKIMEVCAYREVLLRQRVNEAVKAITLAYAEKTDLDQIAARYDVERLLLVAEDLKSTPPTLAVYEDDDSLRRRVQLSFEGFSTAGPEGAYVFHALGADADVLDVAVDSPTPGVVSVAVLSRESNGTPSVELLAAVNATLSADDVRPLTDNVHVVAGNIINYSVTASLVLFDGPDATVVIETARAAMQAYANASHRLGRDVTLSGVYAALHQPGVQRVALAAPVASIVTAWNQAAYCIGITLTLGGIDA